MYGVSSYVSGMVVGMTSPTPQVTRGEGFHESRVSTFPTAVSRAACWCDSAGTCNGELCLGFRIAVELDNARNERMFARLQAPLYK